jgi:HAE1 family hydrophobic/amphiphilic exporter-1
MSLVETSVKKPLLIVVIFTILTLGGIICYSSLNLNLLPSIEVPVLTVQTIYPGAGSAEVETSVSKKIEDALSSLENLNKISSISMESYSLVIVQLRNNADANMALQEAQRKISAIKSNLPSEMREPSIGKISLDETAVLNVAAFSALPSTQFYKLVDDRIQARLAKLPGVGSIKMTGGSEREIKVNIDAQKLKAYNLSILQVLGAIKTSNLEIPAGNIENTDAVYSVRLAAKYSNLDELRQTVIAVSPFGGDIRVIDVAEVEDGIAEQKFVNRIDGYDAIGISILKQSDANAVKVAELAKAELKAIEKEYEADGVRFEIATDESIYTKATANAVIFDLFLAILIVAIICFIFLHDLRSAVIIMFVVPLSIIPAFIVMYILGYSLNLLSLMALSLVVGILVDDSIVVVENIFQHLEAGKSKREAVLDACKQIIFTCLTTALVLTVVFIPMIISGGMIGNLLKEFSVPIAVIVICSFLVSFTVTPLMMSRFGKLSDHTRKSFFGRFSRLVENAFEAVRNWYLNILTFGLCHKKTVLSLALVLFLASFILFPAGLIGVAFMPDSDRGEFSVELDMNPQVTVYQNNKITMLAEKIIGAIPEVERIYANVGVASNGSAKNSISTITVKLVDKEKRKISVEECAQQAKKSIMSAIPGVRARATVLSTTGGGSDPIQFIVQGADFEQVQETATKLLDLVRRTPGTSDARLSVDNPRQEVQVQLDRNKMAMLGLSVSDVGSTLRVALAGNDDSKFSDGNYEYNIRVGIDNFDRNRSDDVAKLTILNRKGELIELNQIADIKYGLGPSALERTNRISSITVKSGVVGRPSGTVGSEIKSALEGNIPAGVSILEGGMMEQQGDAFGMLGFAFLAAIVLIYLIMVVLYNSLLTPVVVLFSIPLSMIGAFLALGLTMNPLSIFSIIGLIVLIGLVSKNAILLVDFAERMRREKNLNAFNAMIEAGKARLRPILMTSFAMIFGMLPIALATGNGAELKNGMAWVIIGGLTSSLILTLIVVPVVYLTFDRIKARIGRLRVKRVDELEMAPVV